MAVQSRSLATRVIVAADDPLRKRLRNLLENELGHRLVGEASTGTDMIRTCLVQEADVVIFDVRLPRVDGLRALKEIRQERPCAALAVLRQDEFPEVHGSLKSLNLPHVFKPVELESLGKAIQAAARGMTEEQSIDVELFNRALVDRSLVADAKALLIRQFGLSEPSAHRMLQRSSMNRRLPMVKIAREILSGSTRFPRWDAVPPTPAAGRFAMAGAAP